MVAVKSTLSTLFTVALWGSAKASCNVGGCIGALEGSGVAAIGACSAATFTAGLLVPADIACIAAISSAAIATVATCAQCAVAQPCDDSDTVAAQRGCSQQGPNHCVQDSTSVRHPSKTDKVDGGKTYHCHNQGLVVDHTGATCVYPCSKCSQCAGVPTNAKRQLEQIFVA